MPKIVSSAQFLRRAISLRREGCQRGARTLRDAVPAHRIQLSNLVCSTSLTGNVENELCHVCFDYARADRVYPDVSLLQLVHGRFREGVDAVVWVRSLYGGESGATSRSFTCAVWIIVCIMVIKHCREEGLTIDGSRP